MIKLCYKEYDFKISLNACKVFYDQTGLDLQTVFMKYISFCSKTKDMSLMERLVAFSEVYSRDIASKALYVIIKEAQDGISLAEIEDATYRVSWLINTKDNDISEPWPLVMLDVALQINDYFVESADIKKMDTSEAITPR